MAQNIIQKVRLIGADILATIGIDEQFGSRIKTLWHRILLPRKKQLEVLQDLQSWLEDGGNVVHACRSILRSAESANELNKPYARAIQEIYDAALAGQDIADGMQNWFDREVIMIFSVGQKANALGEMLTDYLKQSEELEQAKAEFIKPLRYPVLLFFISLGIAIFLAVFVLPQFVEVIPQQRWPDESQMFYALYNAVWDSKGQVLAAVLVVAAFFSWWLVNGTGKVRRALQRVFPFSIYSYIKAMQVSKLMALLVGRIYSPKKCAQELAKTATPFLKWHLDVIVNRESQGSESIAWSFDTGLFPKRLVQRMEGIISKGDANSKLKALETAGKRSGAEALSAINKTKVFVLFGLYAMAGGNLIFAITGFIGVYMEILSQM